MYNIQAIQDGDEQAFREFYNRFYDQLINFVKHRIRNPAETKDLVQNVFLKVLEKKAHLSRDTDLTAFMYAVTRNLLIDDFRKHKAQDHHLVVFHNKFPPSVIDCVETTIVVRENLRAVLQVIEFMPKQRKIIYKLNKLCGLSNQEIAELLSLSKRTIENQIYQANKFLKNTTSKPKAY